MKVSEIALLKCNSLLQDGSEAAEPVGIKLPEYHLSLNCDDVSAIRDVHNLLN